MAAVVRLEFVQAEARPTPVLELPAREPSPNRDRRSMHRVAAPFEVRVRGESDWLAGVDLSFGGLMCLTRDPVWPGNVLDLELRLPDDSERLHLAARVVELVSVRGQLAMRLRFAEVSPRTRLRVGQWVQRAL